MTVGKTSFEETDEKLSQYLGIVYGKFDAVSALLNNHAFAKIDGQWKLISTKNP